MGRLLARAMGNPGLAQVQHIRPVKPSAARGTVDEVYRQVVDDFGMLAPPIALHSPAPPALAASWLMLRETLLTAGPAERAAREAVAAAVSHSNRCPYCVEVHGATLTGLVGRAGAPAVVTRGAVGLADPRLRELAAWAEASGSPDPARRPPPPFPAAWSAGLIGVAVTFHYLNRMVNVFLTESPLPALPPAVRAGARRVAAGLFGALARTDRPPGRSLALLPPAAATPPDLAWAAGNPSIVDALARAVGAVDGCAATAAPEPLRRLVRDRLARTTDGTPGPIGRPELDALVAPLAPAQRPAGRLALLVALASYQVTDRLIDEVRAGGHDDAALVALSAWASLTAARQVGVRLHEDLRRSGGGQSTSGEDTTATPPPSWD
ncbi:carboxymuconolactone decarboxylase family protein [Micromonospora sp. NPDC051227]|uniref:carboxymuconolactone decarboxylase family protein n=1 Tax=Micromonospora sp. NPDC051227 TaxID=3364285 RepID=UPI0037AA1716